MFKETNKAPESKKPIDKSYSHNTPLPINSGVIQQVSIKLSSGSPQELNRNEWLNKVQNYFNTGRIQNKDAKQKILDLNNRNLGVPIKDAYPKAAEVLREYGIINRPQQNNPPQNPPDNHQPEANQNNQPVLNAPVLEQENQSDEEEIIEEAPVLNEQAEPDIVVDPYQQFLNDIEEDNAAKQAYEGNATNASDIFRGQRRIDELVNLRRIKRDLTRYARTAGFEFEFGTLSGPGVPASHTELAVSQDTNVFGLPYKLEMDASNAIELVTPPYIYKNKEGGRINNEAIISDKNYIANYTEDLRSEDGNQKEVADLQATLADSGAGIGWRFTKPAYRNIAVGQGNAKHGGRVATHINVALTAKESAAILNILRGEDDDDNGHLRKFIANSIKAQKPYKDLRAAEKQLLHPAITHISRSLSQLDARPSIDAKKLIPKKHNGAFGALKGSRHSSVKDRDNLWVKDNPAAILKGALAGIDKKIGKALSDSITNAINLKLKDTLKKEASRLEKAIWSQHKKTIKLSTAPYDIEIDSMILRLKGIARVGGGTVREKNEDVKFLQEGTSKKGKNLGIRRDTFLNGAGNLENGEELHVTELRGGPSVDAFNQLNQ